MLLRAPMLNFIRSTIDQRIDAIITYKQSIKRDTIGVGAQWVPVLAAPVGPHTGAASSAPTFYAMLKWFVCNL